MFAKVKCYYLELIQITINQIIGTNMWKNGMVYDGKSKQLKRGSRVRARILLKHIYLQDWLNIHVNLIGERFITLKKFFCSK